MLQTSIGKQSCLQSIPWQLIWLASYPKSGNTWFRIFLTNYLQNTDEPAFINELEKSMIASCRYSLDSYYGIDSADLDLTEIDERRPALYAGWQRDKDKKFHKVHDAYTYLPNGLPLLGIPTEQAAIYFIRNPLDVCVSFAHHNATDDIDLLISHMNNDQYCLCGTTNQYTNQLRQQLLSWSKHVLSWQNAPLPILILRYEDMVSNTFETFSQAIKFLGLDNNKKRIQRALAFSQFETLQQQEQSKGFQERSPNAKSFFRKGQVGSYREVLNPEQINRILQDHAIVMKQFGYQHEF